MSTNLQGPVGLRNRAANTRNLQDDQATVIQLLASIPDGLGGKQMSWSTAPLSGPSGQCPELLANAIWDFQVFWKKRGVFHNIDGVVDPYGHTLRQMISLSLGKPSGPSSAPDTPSQPADNPNTPDAPLNPVITRLQRIFSYPSSWRFTSSSGVNASVGVMGGGVGVLYLENTESGSITPAQRRLIFGGMGGSVGPLPAGVSWSTPNTPSVAVGRIYTREELSLDLSDLNGPAIILSAGCTVGVGLGMTIYLLGVTNVAGWLGAMAPFAFAASLLNAAANAKAMGVMYGNSYGLDIGAGVWQGMAVAEPTLNDLFNS